MKVYLLTAVLGAFNVSYSVASDGDGQPGSGPTKDTILKAMNFVKDLIVPPVVDRNTKKIGHNTQHTPIIHTEGSQRKEDHNTNRNTSKQGKVPVSLEDICVEKGSDNHLKKDPSNPKNTHIDITVHFEKD